MAIFDQKHLWPFLTKNIHGHFRPKTFMDIFDQKHSWSFLTKKHSWTFLTKTQREAQI